MDADRHDAWKLPRILAEIEQIVGRDAALAVGLARGGQRVSIPRYPGPTHWLSRAIGHEMAQQVADHFSVGNAGIKDLEIPIGRLSYYKRRQIEKRAEFLALFKGGYSHNEVCWRMGCSRRNSIRQRSRLIEEGHLSK